VPLDRREPEHLAERDGHEREVDAAAVRKEAGDEGAGDQAGRERGAEPEPQALERVQLEQTERVGADAEEGAVAERGQAGQAE
jgi:hypothetical protein